MSDYQTSNRDWPNVLIVDDNDKNIFAMKKVLSELSVNLYAASSGTEALQLVLRHSFAVIFLDVQMPEMDGYEVAQCLAQNKDTASIPIVLVTANFSSEKNVLQGYKSGAVDYLTKPINPDILIAKTKIFMKLYDDQIELTRAARKLEEIVNIDVLTSLPNRYQFNHLSEKILSQNKRHNRKFALFLLDLDDFKAVNDTLGHDMGDLLLKETAERLVKAVRVADHVARLGGDEFAILLPEINDYADVSLIADKIIDALAKPYLLNAHKLEASASIGIACYPRAGLGISELYKAADVALYKSKSKGKNTYEYYNNTLDKEHLRKITIQEELYSALKANKITLAYLPYQQLVTSAISGIDVVPQWHSDEIGDISEDELFKAAEDTGQIEELGTYLLDKALGELSDIKTELPSSERTVSMRFSSYQLLNSRYIAKVQAIFKEYAWDIPSLICVFKESLFSMEDKKTDGALSQWKKLGLGFSVSDFCGEHFRFSRLKSVPVDCLSLSESLIANIDKSSHDEKIILSVMQIASIFNLKVKAVGVNNQAQANFLKNHGCDYVQGYLVAEPMKVSQLKDFLSQ